MRLARIGIETGAVAGSGLLKPAGKAPVKKLPPVLGGGSRHSLRSESLSENQKQALRVRDGNEDKNLAQLVQVPGSLSRALPNEGRPSLEQIFESLERHPQQLLASQSAPDRADALYLLRNG